MWKIITEFFRNRKLDVKISLLGAGSVLLTATILVLLAIWQSSEYNLLAQKEVDQLIDADLDHITNGIFNLVQTEDEAIQQQLSESIKVAALVLEEAGGMSFSKEMHSWEAVNQLTGEMVRIDLPKILIGSKWIGANSGSTMEMPVVDKITHLVGDTATIFQRMNDRGDMLRVATTVRDPKGNRAVGTFIPAINLDQTPNAVISSILEGKTYQGRAYVVHAWYLTAYAPLKDKNGNLLGMLYVGTKQSTVESRLRRAILQTKVGKTGYVYILGAQGEERGQYVFSQGGERDGENIWDNRDSDGRLVIQEIIKKAVVLKSGQLATERYRWQNPGEPEPRWKVARLAYYEPWDWVIGVGVHEDELRVFQDVLSSGRIRMSTIMSVAGILISILIALLGVIIARTIVRPVRIMTAAVENVAMGQLDQVLDIGSQDEVGVLAKAFNRMTDQLKETIEKMRKSEEKYRLIFENAAEGLFQSTVEGRFTDANPALAHILGYESAVELLHGVTDIEKQIYVRSQDREFLLSSVLRKGFIQGFECQVLKKDGRKIWVSIGARLILGPEKTLPKMEGFFVDIDDRKSAEKALHESQEHYRILFEDSPVALLEEDLSQVRVYLEALRSSGVENLWGYYQSNPRAGEQCARRITVLDTNRAMVQLMQAGSKKDLLDSYLALFQEDVAHVFCEACIALFEKRQPFEKEVSLKTLLGNAIVVILHMGVVPGYEESMGKVLISLLDITERKREEDRRMKLEEDLRQAQKMETVGLLAGGVAHDFNNLLTPIIGYAEILIEKSFTDQAPLDQLKKLEQIKKAAERAKDLTHRLLAFSRKEIIELKPIDLGRIIQQFQDLIRRTIREDIKIEVRIAADLGVVLADAGQIDQVLFNLSINAQDAMPEGGVLVIEAANVDVDESLSEIQFGAQPGKYVLLSVSDTGQGMDEETQKRIFEPFFTTKEIGKGTGLGLSTVFGIVKRHGGFVLVHSEKAQGTIFKIFLPCISGMVNVRKESQPTHQMPTSGHETVLLVEDEELVRILACSVLESFGYKVLVANNSGHCVQLAMEHDAPIHLLLTDVVMPEINGRDLFNKLKATRPDLKVLYMSGYTKDIIGHHGVLTEDTPFLQKPFSLKDLATKVRYVLDRDESSALG